MKLVNRKSKIKSKDKSTVVLTSFKRINPRDFSLCHGNCINLNKEIILCSNDGRIFVNKDMKDSAYMYEFFCILTSETTETLLAYKAEYEKKFPEIKSFDDLINVKDKEANITYALALLSIPIELNRRKIASNRYNCDIHTS